MFYFIKCRKKVGLTFDNEFISIHCIPNCPDGLDNDNFDSSPSNGEFSFYFDNEQITFSSVKIDRSGMGGGLYITIKLTTEIKKSFDKAMSDWKQYLKEKEEEDAEEEEYSDF